MSAHQPIEKEFREKMNRLARVIDQELNPNRSEGRENGFVVLMFKFGAVEAGRMNYISNAQREDMVCALKELVAQFEGRVMPEAKGQ